MLDFTSYLSFIDPTDISSTLWTDVSTLALSKLEQVFIIYISFVKTISRDYFHHLCSSMYLLNDIACEVGCGSIPQKQGRWHFGSC